MIKKLFNIFRQKLLYKVEQKEVDAHKYHLYDGVARLWEKYDPDIATKKGLTYFERKVFSQNGEDGVIAEIFHRIGVTNSYFVEFGAADGLIANSSFLADILGWSGLLVEPYPPAFASIKEKYKYNKRVTCANDFITPANIEEIFGRNGVPEEFDLLSIDIDSADYWVWKAITSYSPRLVIIEYNAALGLDDLVQPPDPGYTPEVLGHFGASLAALARLGNTKGYRLVHCDLTGDNAFFVRADLAGDKFEGTPEELFRPINHPLTGMRLAPLPPPARFIKGDQ